MSPHSKAVRQFQSHHKSNGRLVFPTHVGYRRSVKFPAFVRRISSLFVVCGVAFAFVASAQNSKPIRLRNPLSNAPTPARTQSLVSKPAPSQSSGLFVIQFRESLKPQWRVQLAKLGVTLLNYIPDDAFVAKFENVSAAEIRALGFVQFVGEYRAEQKVHSRLRQAVKSLKEDNVEIAVLLSAQANESDAQQAKGRFTQITQETKLGSGRVLRGAITKTQLDSLAASDFVLWIESAPKMKLNDEIASKIVAGDGGPNLLAMQSLGYDGSGVKVAVADSGLNNGDALTMHPDLLGRTPAFFYYGAPGQLDDAADEHSHGTHCAGIIAGNGNTGETDADGNLYGLGVAPGASIIAQRIFDGVGNYAAPPSYERLTRDAKRAVADIGSNSWGDDTQGRYDISAMEFDALVRDADALTLGDQQYILEFSAGNAGSGQQTIGSPAVAKNVIATGASQNNRVDFVIYGEGPEAMADFSSRGPCEDGRIKPDVCAPGTWIASLQSASATDQYAWAGISPLYQYQGGTSQAGPHVSGAAAVFVQFYRTTHTNATPSPALVKAALINSAVDLDDASGTGPTPNNDEGWGRVDLTQIIGSTRAVDFVDQSVLLTNNQLFEKNILVASGDEPLKFTLTYTDVPGFPGAIPALVNDLDLEVVAPNGAIFRGNQFDRGESVANATGHDSINNVEGIYIAEPAAGEYIVRVRARKVVQDARVDSLFTDQDFALVTSADLVPPGVSLVALDRGAYRAPDTMKLTVIDRDRAGSASVAVLVRSTTETLGENYTLLANGNGGSFTGSVATLTGVAVNDSKLQIAHGNQIEVRYFDASANLNRSSFAIGDLVAPIITSVTTTNEFGLTVISWTTDEPATSTVRYNTNSTLNKVATSTELTSQHSVGLSGLIAGRTYSFHVASTDEAGNTSTNNNGGALFNFVAPTVAKVLLVDDYTDLLFDVPPLSGYTATLTQLGISYEVWNTSVNGSPGLTNLLPYRCVMWRLPEFVDTWTLAEQNALRDYVAGGGSLFVASMEVLSRLEEGGFNSTKLALLHSQNFIPDNDPGDVADVIGAANDPIGNGINVALDYAPYVDSSGFKTLLGIPEDLSDTFTPEANATPVFFNSDGETTGMKWPRTGMDALGRVVFLSFPLDAVPTTGTTNNRANLLGNILGFLIPGFDGHATLALDQAQYTIPSQLVIEVNDADLAGSGSLNVSYSSTTQTTPTTLTILETARPGTFRGTLSLVSQTNSIAAGKLRAKNGDTVNVTYTDASAATIERASASVDTIVPSLTSVVSTADYESFTVSWTSSEPCNSLVQYGESQFLDRSVSDALLTTDHEVTVSGLQPNTTYYFQVVGSDSAGNTVVNDNSNNLFTVHTRVPIIPPWSDNLNAGATNWTTFSADNSQSPWTHGSPSNSIATAAHSPTKCWASCINDTFMDYTETFLVSPAIQLTGGNSAKLTFWHTYDFTDKTGSDIFEAGTLYVITAGGSQSIPLTQYVDANADWELETIDLTPYAGQVVYFVWAHQLTSFDIGLRSGWLVDDVAVTVTNVIGGVINITNNIWQANTFLSGPTSKNVKGRFGHITNAPAGEYVLEFADILFYNTPITLTNTLTPGGTLNFSGNYTFVDVNTNGIPDAWEAAQFSGISSQRSKTTDTDADGMSDWAEFVAGSDPNNPPPQFKLAAQRLANNIVKLSWPSVTNHSYRVHASSNAVSWTPHSAWFTATGTNTSYSFSSATNGAFRFFRVEAAAPASPIAATFRVTATQLINKQIRLDWPSAPGHGYRILGSVNMLAWNAYSDWIRASGYTTGLTLPTATNGAPKFFRVEAQP